MTNEPSGLKVGDVWRYPISGHVKVGMVKPSVVKTDPARSRFLSGAKVAKRLPCCWRSHQRPQHTACAIEVPEIGKRRAKLDHSIRLWVILDERNEDVPNQSYYFEAGGYLGQFSAAFTKKIPAGKIDAIKARRSIRSPTH